MAVEMSGGLGDGDKVRDIGEDIGVKHRVGIRDQSRKSEVKIFSKKLFPCRGTRTGAGSRHAMPLATLTPTQNTANTLVLSQQEAVLPYQAPPPAQAPLDNTNASTIKDRANCGIKPANESYPTENFPPA